MSEAHGPGSHRRETKTLQFARFIVRNRAYVATLLVLSTLFWLYPIVNTISSAGLQGQASQSNYGAAKAGIAAMTIIASLELANPRRTEVSV